MLKPRPSSPHCSWSFPAVSDINCEANVNVSRHLRISRTMKPLLRISVGSDSNNRIVVFIVFLFFNPLIPVCCNLTGVTQDTELCCSRTNFTFISTDFLAHLALKLMMLLQPKISWNPKWHWRSVIFREIR